MDTFLTKQEINTVRMKDESNEHWAVKKRFLLRHLSSYPKNRLLCLAQTFMNINFLGCIYNDELMKEVNKLGDGIIQEVMQKRKKGPEEERLIGRDPKKPKIEREITSAEESLEAHKRKVFVFLKAQSGITEKGLDPLQRLNQIVSRVKVGWELKDVEGITSVVIDDVVVLSNKFLILKSTESKQYAAAAVLHAINMENVEIRLVDGRFELWRGDVGPKDCYLNYIKSLLKKVHTVIPVSGSPQRRLEAGFRTSGTPLDYRTKKGKGWEQEISFFVMNILLGSKVLRKGDCTKSKENQHKEALASEIIQILSHSELTIEEKGNGFLLGGGL